MNPVLAAIEALRARPERPVEAPVLLVPPAWAEDPEMLRHLRCGHGAKVMVQATLAGPLVALEEWLAARP